jgi:hypothetical protein
MKLFLMAVVAMFTVNASAQKDSVLGDPTNYDQGFRVGFGLNVGYVPDDLYDWAGGIDARVQYDFSKRTSITLTTGFTNLFIGNDVPDLGFIPLKAGFKFFWWEDQFYGLVEAGGGFPVTNDYSGKVDNTIILSPGIGYATKYVDFSLRYEHYSAFPSEDGGEGIGQVALRLAYGFKI